MKQFEAFKSNFFRKEDVMSPAILTIAGVSMEVLKSDRGDEEKPVMAFREDERKLVLNVTNWVTLENVYGPESNDWTGKTIELYCDPNVMMGKERKGGIRVRLPAVMEAAESPLSWEAAITLCESVGLTKTDLVARLKQAGRTQYNTVRDAAVVRLLVKEVARSQTQDLEQTDDIPF